MTVEIAPVGITCNLGCTYCYQHPMRDAGNHGPNTIDWDKLMGELEKTGEDFVLFGGEALLTPKKDIEKLFKYGYERFGRNDLQTNGVLLDEDHIELCKQYNGNLGFSIDGPDELNDLRWAGSLEKTRKNTQKSLSNLEWAINEGIEVGLIITLHRVNAGTRERIDKLKEFLYWLDDININSIRLHDLEVDTDLTARKHVLTDEEKISVFLEIAELQETIPSLHLDIFEDIRSLLNSSDVDSSCTWGACDPLNTQAVYEISGNGTIANCGMVNKDGINWVKSEDRGYERYIALYQTPQENGGCQGCRFWSMCRGQCPGSATNGDWRNKSDGCQLWKSLFTHFENEILEKNEVVPFSLRPDLPLVEEHLLEAWKNGDELTLEDAIHLAESSNKRIQAKVK